jgi:hypothetical protein
MRPVAAGLIQAADNRQTILQRSLILSGLAYVMLHSLHSIMSLYTLYPITPWTSFFKLV